MFKLYGYVNGQISFLGATFYESEVIKKIQKYLNPEDVHFIIIKETKYMDIPYKTILSEEEFIEYADEYSERIMKDYSAVELKRKILELENKKIK